MNTSFDGSCGTVPCTYVRRMDEKVSAPVIKENYSHSNEFVPKSIMNNSLGDRLIIHARNSRMSGVHVLDRRNKRLLKNKGRKYIVTYRHAVVRRDVNLESEVVKSLPCGTVVVSCGPSQYLPGGIERMKVGLPVVGWVTVTAESLDGPRILDYLGPAEAHMLECQRIRERMNTHLGEGEILPVLPLKLSENSLGVSEEVGLDSTTSTYEEEEDARA